MAKKRNKNKRSRLPVRRARTTPNAKAQKMSEIVLHMAMRVMKVPLARASEPAAQAVLMLAAAAWNSAVGNNVLRNNHRVTVAQIDWGGTVPWGELRSDDTEQLIEELVAYKKAHYPADFRCISAVGVSPEGNVQVHWTDPDEVVAAAFAAAGGPAPAVQAKRGHPIADKLVAAMHRYSKGKVVDLHTVIRAKRNAAELQTTVATLEDLADLHPANALYAYAQNQMSILSEQLTALKEMTPFVDLIAKAEDEYLPSGPLRSPLTTSFFTPIPLAAPRPRRVASLLPQNVAGVPASATRRLRAPPEVWAVAHILERVRVRGLPEPPERRHLSGWHPRCARQPSALFGELLTAALRAAHSFPIRLKPQAQSPTL